jgi:hypothetical protein
MHARWQVVVGFLVAIGIVIGVGVYFNSGPRWVGTTKRVTVTMSGPCANPSTLFLHGYAWDASTLVHHWQTPEGESTHAGRIHFDTAHSATFTADDGTVVHYTGGSSRFSTMPCAIQRARLTSKVETTVPQLR